MATKTTNRRIPKLGRHSSGQARVTLNGKPFYLGLWGTLDAQKNYADLIARWEGNDRQPLTPTPTCVQTRKVRDVVADFLAYIDATGRYMKNGAPTPAKARARRAVNEFAKTCGDVLASKLSDVLLIQHRDVLEKRQHITRAGINQKVGLIRAALKWAKNRGLLTRAQWLAIAEVEPLSKAECGGRDRKMPKRAVSVEDVEKTAAVASPLVSKMLRVQCAIGCRPGEVAGMKWSDISPEPIDVDGVACRVFVVEHAKTEHHGHDATTYALPPSVMDLLGTPKGPGHYVFPSPVTGKPYAPGAYRTAVVSAARRAGVEPFAPHAVRHGFLTRAANRYGVLAAAAAANHADARVTQGYLHKNVQDGYRVVVGLLTGEKTG